MFRSIYRRNTSIEAPRFAARRGKQFRKAALIFVCAALMAHSASAHSPVEIHSGQTIPLFGVYWISNCFSRFKQVVGIETKNGGELLSISVNQPMTVRTWQCNNDVPGAQLYLTAKEVSVLTKVQLQFSVKYDTLDGQTADNQLVSVTILP